MKAQFKGKDILDGATLRWTPGIQPSATTVRMLEPPEAGDVGKLSLTDGFGKNLEVDMVVESVAKVFSGEGTVHDVVLKDLRAFWKFGGVMGRHNQPDAAGRPTKEKSLKMLALECLVAMPGQPDFTIDALPDNEYPPVDWVFANPAEMLQSLLGSRYSIVYQLDGGVDICKTNEGKTYEDESEYLALATAKRKDRDYAFVAVVGGANIRQVTRKLVLLGLDVDGKWKALKELSYAPDSSNEFGGFCTPFYQDGFEMMISDAPELKDLVPHIFRVWGGIPAAELPVLRETCTVEIDDETGETRYAPPGISGSVPKTRNGLYSGEDEERKHAGYSIDEKAGLVKFDDPQVVTPDDTKNLNLAASVSPVGDMTLTYAYQVMPEHEEDVYICGALEQLPGEHKYPLVVKCEQLVLRQRSDARAGCAWAETPESTEWEDVNKDELDEYAKTVHDAYEDAEEIIDCGSITLIGLRPEVELDGLSRSVTFTVGRNGSTTEIEWGHETPQPEIPTYAERLSAKTLERVLGAKADKNFGKQPGYAVLSGAAAIGQPGGGALTRPKGLGPRTVQGATLPHQNTHAMGMQLCRNLEVIDCPPGRPVSICGGSYSLPANPMGDDGIWNISSTYTGDTILGISAVNIPAAHIRGTIDDSENNKGWVKMPPYGPCMIDVTRLVGMGHNIQLGSVLAPDNGNFDWVVLPVGQSGPVMVLKRFDGENGWTSALAFVNQYPTFTSTGVGV